MSMQTESAAAAGGGGAAAAAPPQWGAAGGEVQEAEEGRTWREEGFCAFGVTRVGWVAAV